MTDETVKHGVKAKIVRCPTCRGDSLFDSTNDSRPFCSPLCKNVDLGAWANEEFRVNSKNTEGDDLLDDATIAVDAVYPDPTGPGL